jgi:collagenase-like PrtC family protease
MPAGIESEVFGWGRLPLAYSARCYTARAHKVSKDDCANCCLDYPDGLMLSTREDKSFLVINGIQTQSARVHSLIHELNDPATGLDILRISPQSKHTERVISLFDQVRAGTLEATETSQPFAPVGLCDGYWHGAAGMAACGGDGGP